MIPSVMEDAVLVDAAVALYALNPNDPRSAACRELLSSLGAGRGRGYGSVELIQEIAFHRLRITGDARRACAEAKEIMSRLTILNFDREILDTSLRLIEQLPGVRGRDAGHAATALAYGIGRIASTDPAFDRIPGLTRIDPVAVS